jgi:hypothetical protein
MSEENPRQESSDAPWAPPGPSHWVIPDLADLRGNVMMAFIANMLSNQAGPTDFTARQLLTAYIRVVDKAVTDYQLDPHPLKEWSLRRTRGGVHDQ